MQMHLVIFRIFCRPITLNEIVLLLKKYKLVFRVCLGLILSLNFTNINAQPISDAIVKDVLHDQRVLLYRNIVKNGIQKNFAQPLNDNTEENYLHAFESIAILNFREPWTTHKLLSSFQNIESRSETFQLGLLQLGFALYPNQWEKEVEKLLEKTTYDKVKAASIEYLASNQSKIKTKYSAFNKTDSTSVLLMKILANRLPKSNENISKNCLRDLMIHPFIKGMPVIYSLQRRNRNYPGAVIVRADSGEFLTENKSYFFVPQLARSVFNFPFYLTNGNTPQGIFKIDGFGVSKSNFIGPTTNIQLKLPFECSPKLFFCDSAIAENSWSIELYKKLLPLSCRENKALFEAFYAGQIGRREIIAHGTTINPEYYKQEKFYPITPSLGCLSTKEIWNEQTGRLQESDQQKLIEALNKAGIKKGFLVVIEIDDQQKAIDKEEIEKLMSLLH